MGVLKVRVGDEWVSVGGGTGGTREAGEVSIWPTDTPPAGWALCDGAAVSRTTYAELFSRIGTTYGAGDGSTTFNLPNIKGRVPVGMDAAQTEFDALGETGGAKTHTLTTAEMPSHTHNVTYRANATGLGDWDPARASGTGSAGPAPTAATGGGGAHNNLQPYIALNYIIRLTTDRGGVKVLATPVMKVSNVSVNFPAAPTLSPFVAIPGLTHTFTVASVADVFAVEIVIDMSGTGTGVAHLFVDGVQQASAAVIGQSNDQRVTAGQNYQISGLSPGSHTFDVRAYKSGSVFDMYSGHCTMSIRQVPTVVGDVTVTVPGPAFVTSLPASPVDGQEVYYEVSAAMGAVWHLRYRASSPSAYKWEYLGGPPMHSTIDAQVGPVTSASMVDISGGPSITVPNAGDYMFSWGVLVQASVATALAEFGIRRGGVPPAGPALAQPAGANYWNTLSKNYPMNLPSPNTVCAMQGQVNTGTFTVQRRWLNILPYHIA